MTLFCASDVCRMPTPASWSARAPRTAPDQGGRGLVKAFQTGSVIDPHRRIDAVELTPGEFDTAVETTRVAGLPVAVHAHNKTAILRRGRRTGSAVPDRRP